MCSPKANIQQRSPSGDFAFGFQRVDATDLFVLSIWYDEIPEKTIAWYPSRGGPRGGDPVKPVPRGSKVELTAADGLLLTDPRGEQLWRSGALIGTVAYGVMNDTGNFVLLGHKSDRLWQSFEHPTDTLLPGQSLEVNGQLFSRQKENNCSQGRFQLRLLQDGNLVLNTVDLVTKFAYDAYYISGTYDPADGENSGYQLVFENSGYLYILRRNGKRFNLTDEGSMPTVDGYHRASLNFEGVFSQYFYKKGGNRNAGWSVLWYEPDNVCVRIQGESGISACGFNSICSLDDNRRKRCKCVPGYSPLDPNDEFRGCKPDFELGCPIDGKGYREDLYDIVELPDVAWLKAAYERYKPYNEVYCRAACASDCLCAAATFRDDFCVKVVLPLANGRLERSLNSKSFVKVRRGDRPGYNSNNQRSEAKGNGNGLIITVSALLGTSVFVNFMLIMAFCISFFFIYHRKYRKGELETNVRIFTYRELAEATNNFKEELGNGAFGVVYKGKLKIGPALTCVAVKKLDRLVRDHGRNEEFRTEVKVIGQVHHKNLVRLLGICEEGEQRLLVYVFLSNGTLADFLFGDSKPSCNQRVQIALGIARGLLYLHEECSSKIIHCDIKPQNILLDDYYSARIFDFGLAKLLGMDQTQTQTGIRGTKGYVAPEWFRNLPITTKVDVYSFGVILLEIICCRRNVDLEMGEGERAILTDWVCDCFRDGTTMELVKDDMEAMSDVKTLERFIMVAIWCIQEDPSLRPAMRKVNQMLEGVVQLTLPPIPYAN